MAIEVRYAPSGNIRWITQHYGINGWKLKPMVIPDCARCLGIFMFWKTKKRDIPVYSVTAIHLPPPDGVKSSRKKIEKEYFKKICTHDDLDNSEPYLIILAGGKIDTPQNRTHYERSLRKFVLPFGRIYPNTQIMSIPPLEKVMFTTFILDELGVFRTKIKSLPN